MKQKRSAKANRKEDVNGEINVNRSNEKEKKNDILDDDGQSNEGKSNDSVMKIKHKGMNLKYFSSCYSLIIFSPNIEYSSNILTDLNEVRRIMHTDHYELLEKLFDLNI